MTTLASRQKILIPLIILSFAYILWQLYEEYSITLIEPNLSTNLLLSSTEKLQQALSEQQKNLNALQQEISRANEPTPAPAINSQAVTTQELSGFIESCCKTNIILQTPITWEKTSPIPIKKIPRQLKPIQYTNIEKQLLATNKQFYTLQIMASRKMKKLTDLASNKALQGKTKLLRITQHNQNWYILLYGTYKNYRNAKLAETALPKSLQRLHIWIRPMSSVHEAIHKAKG